MKTQLTSAVIESSDNKFTVKTPEKSEATKDLYRDDRRLGSY
jgi:hypothetical protein